MLKEYGWRVLILSFLVGCQSTLELKPKLAVGEIVRSKLNGQAGQIIARSRVCYDVCLYDVRFAAVQATTQTHVISKDDPISILPLAVVRDMREYELEAIP